MRNPVQFIVLSLVLAATGFVPARLSAQGTAFTYQGQLQSNGSPASGTYNLTFTLFATNTGGTAVAGPVTTNGVFVTNGLFTVTIDFGSSVWNGATNWLQISVETNGAGSFSTLSPRQRVTPAPYAIFAGGADAAGLSGTVPMSSLSGTYGGILSLTNGGNSFTGNGTGLANVNAAALDGLSAANFWQVGGNSGVPSDVNYVGNNDNQYLDLHANGVRAMRLRLQSDAADVFTNAPNVLGGSSLNLAAAGVVGATIAGGGGNGTNAGVLGAFGNEVGADFGAIGGGIGNTNSGIGSFIGGGGYDGNFVKGNLIAANANAAVIGGGVGNSVFNNAPYSFIGGGEGNQIYGDSNDNGSSVIGGGYNNMILTNAGRSLIGGGVGNQIYGDSDDEGSSVIGGGSFNTISNNAPYSFIGGGFENTIYGDSNDEGSSAIGGGYNNMISTSAPYSLVGSGFENTIYGDYADEGSSVIGGGYLNMILTNAAYSFVGGGYGNQISGDMFDFGSSVIGGGSGNAILTNATDSFIGGGYGNQIYGDMYDDGSSVIGGGDGNLILTNAAWSFIGGGYLNQATNFYTTVPGGANNVAGGEYSFAAGQQAQALYQGDFVWADSQSAVFASTANDQFLIRAQGGVGIGTASPDATLSVNGSADKPGGGSWNTFSDGRLKDVGANFTHGLADLQQIQPVHYHYKADNALNLPSQPEYVGVVAQQVRQAIPEAVQSGQHGYLTVNNDPIIWTMVNAIKELNENAQTDKCDSEARIQKLEAENAELKQRLADLEQIVLKQKPN